jgi:hypothetical protein
MVYRILSWEEIYSVEPQILEDTQVLYIRTY